MERKLRSALVVEDDAALRAGITKYLREKGMRVASAATAADAIAQLKGRPDVVLLDVRLPDATAFSVLEASLAYSPAPIRIALSGAATPEEAFRLRSFGVRCYLQKPVSLAEIWDAIQRANREAPEIALAVQDAVGHVSLKDLTTDVRNAAIRQALAIARGNRTRAARILQVTRQAVQQMVRGRGKGSPRP